MRFIDPLAPKRALTVVLILSVTGCQSPDVALDAEQVQRYEERMGEAQELMPELTPIDSPAPVELSGEAAAKDPSLDTAIWLHLPDPSVAREVFDKRLEVTRFGQRLIKTENERIYDEATRLIQEIERTSQVRLALADCIRRALANNYQIKTDGYAPAISTAQVVQAEAAFDVAFFANVNRNNTSTPTPTALTSGATDSTVVSGGIRKLLATGANVTLTQTMVRVDNPGFAFNLLNPSWTQNFSAELRQPLLRNFGIDFNRSQINITKNQRRIDEEAFRARIIDVLNNTEQAYWTLVAARRDVVVSAELLAQARLTYDQVKARIDFDAYKTLLYQSESSVKSREFEYIDVKNRVRNAEDQLLNLLNDPDLPLSANIEIIPVDGPTIIEVVRDRFHAVETAIERRPEIIQARHAVDITRLQLGISKNQALPQLDVIYRVTLNGLGSNADVAFDQMTGANFIDQFVGLELLWNFGERFERAGIRISALRQSQSLLGYKQTLDNIITDCRVALRNIETNFEQLRPSYQGVIAASENLRSLQERQERKSPSELNTILSAQTNLAAARRGLLQSAVNYNTGLVDVERAKGTLLEYNNIILSEQP